MKHLFLIGFMGCGKSTKAKLLGKLLNYPVVDLDAVIVAHTGMPIADYFAQYGEEAFRQLESDTLKTYAYAGPSVVATGGGLPCFFDNMAWMRENGQTVYLEMTPPQLVSRLHNREKRPLIKGMDDAQLLDFIRHKLAERETYYRQAQHVVDAFDLDVDALAQKLV